MMNAPLDPSTHQHRDCDACGERPGDVQLQGGPTYERFYLCGECYSDASVVERPWQTWAKWPPVWQAILARRRDPETPDQPQQSQQFGPRLRVGGVQPNAQ